MYLLLRRKLKGNKELRFSMRHIPFRSSDVMWTDKHLSPPYDSVLSH
jgi:hypothetical protein